MEYFSSNVNIFNNMQFMQSKEEKSSFPFFSLLKEECYHLIGLNAWQ